MLSIKLRRVGKKGQSTFRIIVIEAKSKINGEFIEDLGWVNPHSDRFEIDKERATHWLKNGARPTETAANYLKKMKVELKGRK